MGNKEMSSKEEMWTILENGPKIWTAMVQEDEFGECYLELPPDMMERVGWQEGDDINWSDNGNGSFTLTKVK